MMALTSDDFAVNGVILPLVTTARADEVERRIRLAISIGLIPNGQQLPAETVLASRLGVPLTTLRDALARLREQGLVENRRGRTGGAFVTRPASPAGLPAGVPDDMSK